MKITQFDDLYANKISTGDTLIGGSTGSNSFGFGGDVLGPPNGNVVVNLRNIVSLASNMGDNTVGSVLTTIQSSPWVAQFARPSNTSSGSNAIPWFNVKGYGATGDGSTDDTSSVNSAIAAMNTAGRGVLYFPAGTYKTTGGLTTITAEGIVLGDGMGAYDGSSYGSAVLCTSQTAVLFTITADQLKFTNIGLYNTFAGTASAGTAIKVNGTFIGQKVDLDSVVLAHFYDNMVRDVGSQWSDVNVWNWGPVRYGVSIQNTVNQDAGDWSMANCQFFANTNNMTAHVQWTGAGGGKFVNVKFNNNGGATYTNAIHVAIPTGRTTSVMTVAGCSFENMSGDAILIDTTGTGIFGKAAIGGSSQFVVSGNTGRAVKISAAANGAFGTNGAISGVVIDGIVVDTTGTARAAVELVNSDRVTLGAIQLMRNFTSRYTSSGDTNTTDMTGAGGTVTSVALTVPAEFSVSGSPVTTSGTLAIAKANENNNTVWAGPDSGVPAAPTFRALVGADMPSTVRGEILVSDTPAGSPLVFSDLLQNEAGDDLLYADP